MPTIIAIKPQKFNNRINIYLDDEFGFGLDLQTYLKEGLKVGQVLTQEQVETIVKKGEFQNTYDKILRFATLRPRSEREFNSWLIKHKIHESLKEELFIGLKRLELLDDRKFAIWWIGQRQAFRPKSKMVLTLELRAKGIDKETIEEVLVEEKVDEKSAAKKMLEKKKRLWDKLSGFEKRKKIFGFLMQKGFNTELIRDLISEMEDDV